MSEIFIKMLNMSISASWIVLAVVIVRLLLYRAPKWINCLLWGIVGLRLVMPFSVKSALSLIPSAEPIPQNIIYTQTPYINSGIGAVDNALNPVLDDLSPAIVGTRGIIADITDIAVCVWLCGIALMLIYGVVSYIRLKMRVRISISSDGVYYCDSVESPFILGIIKPRIYLPSGIGEQTPEFEHVISHEKAHIKRGDHLIKPIGFILLALYWFNPVLWVAYILLCRDIERACDERVIKEMSDGEKKGYSEALVACSVHRRRIMACPLAFGEVCVKDRIKSVLNYKKPAFWIIIVALVLSLVLAVCFLTDKISDSDIDSQESYSELEGISLELTDIDLGAFRPYLEIKWKNKTLKNVTFGEEFYLYRNVGGEWVDCRNGESYVWHEIAYLISPRGHSDQTYYIGNMDIIRGEKYRFESKASIDGKTGTVYLEFEISDSEVDIKDVKKRKDYKVVDQSQADVILTVQKRALPESIYSSPADEFKPYEVIAFRDGNTAIYLKSGHYRNDYVLLEFEMSYDLDERGNLLSAWTWNEDMTYSTGVGLTDKRLWDSKKIYEDALYLHGIGEGERFAIMVKTDVLKEASEYISFRVPLNMVYYAPKDFEGTVQIADANEVTNIWPGHYDNENYETYICRDSCDPMNPSITLSKQDGKFYFSFSYLSSYIAHGKYEFTDDGVLILTTDDGYANKYVFKAVDGGYMFVADESTDIPKYVYTSGGVAMTPVVDGAVFTTSKQQ